MNGRHVKVFKMNPEQADFLCSKFHEDLVGFLKDTPNDDKYHILYGIAKQDAFGNLKLSMYQDASPKASIAIAMRLIERVVEQAPSGSKGQACDFVTHIFKKTIGLAMKNPDQSSDEHKEHS